MRLAHLQGAVTRFHRHKCLDTRGFPPLGPLASFSPPPPPFTPPSVATVEIVTLLLLLFLLPSFPCLFPRTCDSCGVRPIHTGDDCVCARTRLVTLSFVNSTISRGRSFTRPRLFCPPSAAFFLTTRNWGGGKENRETRSRNTRKKEPWRMAAGEREENHHFLPRNRSGISYRRCVCVCTYVRCSRLLSHARRGA